MAEEDEHLQQQPQLKLQSILLLNPINNPNPNNNNNTSNEIAENLVNGNLESKIEAARDIRRIIRSSSSSSCSAKLRSRFAAAGVIQPLVCLLCSVDSIAIETSLLALLNLALRNDRNKVKIVTSGAIPPLVELLKLQDNRLVELATAAILTLSGAGPNKPVITSSGVAPLLIKVLISGTIQAKVDAVTALYNLSTCAEASSTILDARAVPPLVNLLKDCKKHSKFAEKTTALLEVLSTTEEGRAAISTSGGGILALVETVEDGSRISMEHAIGALLTLCQSCLNKYRELILNEGAIPGLLRLTVEGTTKSQEKARMLLDLLRESPQKNRSSSSVFEELVYDIATKVDISPKAPETAQKLLQDMLNRSMEISMNQIQLSASSYKSSGVSVKLNRAFHISVAIKLFRSVPDHPCNPFLGSNRAVRQHPVQAV